MKQVFLTARFLSELALLAVLVLAGAGAHTSLPARIVLAIAGPLVAIAVWSMLIAPRARRRLPDPPRFAVEGALFLASAAALAAEGHRLPAAAFAAACVGIAALDRVVVRS